MPRPPRPWFRFHSEALTNLKIHAMPDRLVKPWIFLLCMANEHDPRGQLPSLPKIAFALRVKEERAREIMADLMNLGFVDAVEGAYAMHKWDVWQKDSDARATPGRRKADEARRFDGDKWVNPPPIVASSAAESPPLRRGSAAIDRDKDRDKEKEQDEEETARGETPVVVPVVRAFERCFGRLLSMTEIESIRALADEHPRERIDYALREAADLGKKNVRYVQRICENQEQSGDERTRPNNGTNGAGRHDAAESALPSPNGAYLHAIGFGSKYVEPSRVGLGEEGVSEEVVAVGVEAP